MYTKHPSSPWLCSKKHKQKLALIINRLLLLAQLLMSINQFQCHSLPMPMRHAPCPWVLFIHNLAHVSSKHPPKAAEISFQFLCLLQPAVQNNVGMAPIRRLVCVCQINQITDRESCPWPPLPKVRPDSFYVAPLLLRRRYRALVPCAHRIFLHFFSPQWQRTSCAEGLLRSAPSAFSSSSSMAPAPE